MSEPDSSNDIFVMLPESWLPISMGVKSLEDPEKDSEKTVLETISDTVGMGTTPVQDAAASTPAASTPVASPAAFTPVAPWSLLPIPLQWSHQFNAPPKRQN